MSGLAGLSSQFSVITLCGLRVVLALVLEATTYIGGRPRSGDLSNSKSRTVALLPLTVHRFIKKMSPDEETDEDSSNIFSSSRSTT